MGSDVIIIRKGMNIRGILLPKDLTPFVPANNLSDTITQKFHTKNAVLDPRSTSDADTDDGRLYTMTAWTSHSWNNPEATKTASDATTAEEYLRTGLYTPLFMTEWTSTFHRRPQKSPETRVILQL